MNRMCNRKGREKACARGDNVKKKSPILPQAGTIEEERTKSEGKETRLEERIMEYIKRHAGTTFAGLQRVFGEELDGEFSYGLISQNIVFWTKMNKEFIDIMHRLIKEKKLEIFCSPSNFLCYVADGRALTLPIAKRVNHSYKKPHWIPLTFSVRR